MTRKRRGTLSSEEAALWERVVKDVRPLRKKPDRPPTNEAPKPETASPAERPGVQARGARGQLDNPARSSRTPNNEPSRAPSAARPPALAAGDPRLDRKARRGALKPERTLDLHGLTQISARRRLEQFFDDARRDGVRCALVITGKGARADSSSAETTRGIIRRRFLEWIDAPPLRDHIVRVAGAAPHDGGAGAFYVFFKSGRKAPSNLVCGSAR